MALESASKLFANREARFDVFDIQHGVESFLQQELRSEKVHCRIVGASLRADIRVGGVALAEAVLVREYGIRAYAKQQLQCSLGEIRVILEV